MLKLNSKLVSNIWKQSEERVVLQITKRHRGEKAKKDTVEKSQKRRSCEKPNNQKKETHCANNENSFGALEKENWPVKKAED